MDSQARKKKRGGEGICDIIAKDPFSYVLERLWSVVAVVVSGHWSGQRGEFPVLHHSEGCVQLHNARAAGSPCRWGRRSDCLAPLAQGLWPRFTGQAPIRTQARLLANGASWSVVVRSDSQRNDL